MARRGRDLGHPPPDAQSLRRGPGRLDDPDREAPRGQRQLIYGEYRGISQAPGVLDGNQLQPAGTAVTVRVHDGQTATADGPFAEAGEPLGGYYLIEADHPGAAIELAARIPAARLGGALEVRPVIGR